MTTNGPNALLALSLTDFLPYRLSVASNAVSNRLATVYQDRFGLTVTEWRLMAVLGERAGATAQEVVVGTQLDKVAVSRAAAGLVQKGLLTKRKVPEDGRAAALYLTESGISLYREIAPAVLAAEQDVFATLSDDERRQLEQLLSKVAEGLSSTASPEPA